MKKQNFLRLIVCMLIFLMGSLTKQAFNKSEKKIKVNTQELKENQKTQLLKENEKQYNKYLKKASDCLVKYEFEKSIKYAEESLKYKPKDFLMRALICLNYYEIGEQLDVKKDDEKDKREEIYDKMLEVAEEGIENAPDHGECYFMRGLARARIATTSGILYNLFKARSIKNDWLKAVELKSEYVTPTGEDLLASSYIALGAYYRLCPSFFLLKLIFGIDGDLDKSVEYCKKAYELDPERIEIVKEYGVSLISRGLDNDDEKEIEKGKKYLKMIPDLPIRLKTDPIDIQHSKMLLNDIELCPGYSRDQQQDISEEAYNEIHAQEN